jgi:hypothetical protein
MLSSQTETMLLAPTKWFLGMMHKQEGPWESTLVVGATAPERFDSALLLHRAGLAARAGDPFGKRKRQRVQASVRP